MNNDIGLTYDPLSGDYLNDDELAEKYKREIADKYPYDCDYEYHEGGEYHACGGCGKQYFYNFGSSASFLEGVPSCDSCIERWYQGESWG